MARARKSHISDEEKVKSRGGLEPPRAQTGHNPYVIYADLKRDQDEHARVLILNFAAKYAAHYFINKLIHTDTWEECDPVGSRSGLMTASGVRVTMFDNQIWDLVNYEPTVAEASWQDDQIDKWVLAFKYGRGEGAKDELPIHSPIRKAGESTDEEIPGPVPDRKRVVEKKPPKEVKPKLDTSGHTSANDIAKKLKVEGREVRGVLRALKLEKPSHGWSWPKAEADKIEKQVVDMMKKQMAERSQKLGKKK